MAYVKTIKEFAARANTTEPVIRGWIYRHGLPVIQIGKKIYISEADYQTWLQKKRTVLAVASGTVQQAPAEVVNVSGIAAKMQKVY